MLFAIIAKDKEGAHEVRQDNREAHLKYLKSLGNKLKLAGPFLDPARDIMTGSLLVVEAKNQSAAISIAANDPYARAGLFASVDIRPWKWTVGAPEEPARAAAPAKSRTTPAKTAKKH